MTVHPTHSTARSVSRRRRVALYAASLLCCSAILTALPGGASAAPAAGAPAPPARGRARAGEGPVCYTPHWRAPRLHQ
ncbi:hypothetical protein ACFV0W_25110 [Streptomyces anulatus]